MSPSMAKYGNFLDVAIPFSPSKATSTSWICQALLNLLGNIGVLPLLGDLGTGSRSTIGGGALFLSHDKKSTLRGVYVWLLKLMLDTVK